jgi:UDP:flavonoid glycosyltransferase YjiC (YdhE family)
VGRFVLALHDAGGTVPPMMAIAEVLAAGGHGVTVLGQPSIEGRARRAGCDFVTFTNPDYETDRPIEEQIEAVMDLMAGRGPGDELLRTVEATGADVVVVDANLAGVAAAAEASGCRSAILLHSMFKTYVDTWFGELWPFLAPAINDTRAAFGLDASGSWTETFLGHDRMYAAVPEVFDAPASLAPPPSMRHPGFLVPTAGDPGGSPELDGTGGPVVLVSLSTTDLGQGPLLQTILDALDGQDVDALVTTGAQRFGSSLRVPASVAVRDYVPHASILPHVDAVITHGGLGTVAAALSHGVPLVCTPIARDQPLNAQRVAELGAGVVVPAATATPALVRAALEEVLFDRRHRAAAERVREASAEAGGAVAVAADLDDLSRS